MEIKLLVQTFNEGRRARKYRKHDLQAKTDFVGTCFYTPNSNYEITGIKRHRKNTVQVLSSYEINAFYCVLYIRGKTLVSEC